MQDRLSWIDVVFCCLVRPRQNHVKFLWWVGGGETFSGMSV